MANWPWRPPKREGAPSRRNWRNIISSFCSQKLTMDSTLYTTRNTQSNTITVSLARSTWLLANSQGYACDEGENTGILPEFPRQATLIFSELVFPLNSAQEHLDFPKTCVSGERRTKQTRKIFSKDTFLVRLRLQTRFASQSKNSYTILFQFVEQSRKENVSMGFYNPKWEKDK